MKILLLSGGSGKRLWPLSNDSRSKQFLKVLKTEQSEQLESMLQRIWKQLKSINLHQSSYISTCKAQVDMVLSQIGSDAPLIIEQQRRDTFPAIALASVYLYSCIKTDPNEVVCVLPVDPFVEKSYFEQVKVLDELVQESGANIALMGGTPVYPSEKYGYIMPEKGKINHSPLSYLKVSKFVEKPMEDQAIHLIKQGALWNLGVFAFKLKYMISILQTMGFPVEYIEFEKVYDQLPKISFDFEVVEKADNVIVVPYNGTWKDLGTWNTLTEEMDTTQIGKGIISENSANTHVINELDIPVVVIGVSNIVVASGPQGILISDKAASHKIKDIMKHEEERPMYEERRWGWYQVLDYGKISDNLLALTKKIVIDAGKNISYQSHSKRSEVWTVLSGVGEFALDGRLYEVKQGDTLRIPKEAKHGIKANSTLEIIEVQMGEELVEEDITRLFMTWDEVIKHCEEKIKEKEQEA
ncbi:sugar phosphate nucleotidyltransferase [Pseudoneobacillus rhizosphaerae]|uniref:Mannose-1-phosphate guanylyltransferase RfbM n=1 Tax=Pseudoneobacillus rhizosphaerae TaxID=2880968 RepID=A0A9C7GD94_9BACI|nr:sugar phosphate nucleotidyltransferase [Pseudoneobacillus rhizosphaerae]CAG9610461.1 Mannose-1-phosphate guanylyltransferase RfbM [Pseudoneobacillus rhizosphaerae]